MPNKNYLRGRRFEWEVKKQLEQSGYSVMRTAGSHGFADIIAIRHANGQTHIRFIQCKVVKRITTAICNKLLKELEFPIEHYENDDIIIHTELFIKQQGTKGYEVYSV